MLATIQVVRILAAGEDYTVDAGYYTVKEILEMASATVYKGRGTLTVTNTNSWTEKDKAQATPVPGGGDNGTGPKIKFE